MDTNAGLAFTDNRIFDGGDWGPATIDLDRVRRLRADLADWDRAVACETGAMHQFCVEQRARVRLELAALTGEA